MVSNRSHRFYSCLSFASVKVGGREICKMFSFFVFAPVFGFHCLAFIELVSWSLYLVSNVRYTILQLTDGIQLLLMI